ncbi:DNA-binding protein [Hyalangium sp.]|uniref:DNA-binding protein n=1 Tax=Hyalangium sp. TaxID=2028555 RepID=UPI002D48E123|nr:DNA-binding protein [Hyalangium sp.]HYH96713.1 DNA-binding protein [Hyalangium sp.]
MSARSLPRYTGGLSAVLAAALTVLLPACGGTPSITEVRAQGNGTEATIEGFVSVSPGAFQSALGDEGFAVQDSSGGLYVKMAEKQTFGLGAKVRVTGILDEQNQLRILKAEPAGVKLLGGTEQVSAKTVGTGAVNESVEGQLIQVSGNITQTFQDDSPYGYKLYINDGTGEVQVFVHVSGGFDKAALQALSAGQRITVVGLAAQYETTYEVAPRQPSDLTVQ